MFTIAMNVIRTYALGLEYTRRHIFRYPKFLLLFITFIVAYFMFYSRNYGPFNNFIIDLGYSGTFVAGMMFSYGFSAAPATAVFLILAQHQNIYLASIIGGLGALISDLFIFSFIRQSFAEELNMLSKERIVVYFNNRLPGIFKKYLLPVAAGFVIASPLPDEIGVALLAASKIVSTRIFTFISYSLNTIGIFVVLYIGRLIA